MTNGVAMQGIFNIFSVCKKKNLFTSSSGFAAQRYGLSKKALQIKRGS
jgi:hypothetical protein